MLSRFPARLTPAHVHSVLAWALDHYKRHSQPPDKPHTAQGKHRWHFPQGMRESRGAGSPVWRFQDEAPHAATARAEQHLMEGEMQSTVCG